MLSLALFHSPLNTPVGTTGQITMLTVASARQFEVDLNEASLLSFLMPGRHWQTALIRPGICDVVTFWTRLAEDGSQTHQPIQRYRVLKRQIAAENEVVGVGFSAVSYRGLPEAWIFHDTDVRSYAATAQSLLMWSIFNEGQSKPSGNLGVVRGNIPSPDQLRDRPSSVDPGTGETKPYYDAGKKRLAALQELSQVSGGPEWDIVPSPTDLTELTFDVWNQRGRSDPGAVLDLTYGSTVAALTSDFEMTEYANVTRTTGREPSAENGGAPAAGGAVTIWRPSTKNPTGSPEQGRWEESYSSDAVTSTGVTEHADANLTGALDLQPAWTLRLTEGVWQGPDDLWIGDVTRLRVLITVDDPASEEEEALLDVDEEVRVLKLTMAPDESGAMQVDVMVGRYRADARRFRQELERRLTRLERR